MLVRHQAVQKRHQVPRAPLLRSAQRAGFRDPAEQVHRVVVRTIEPRRQVPDESGRRRAGDPRAGHQA